MKNKPGFGCSAAAEIKDALRKYYYELLRQKYGEPKEMKESRESREPREQRESRESREPREPKEPKESGKLEEREHLPLQKLSKVVEKLTKLHALRKFKIDEDTIGELYRNHKGGVHEFFISLAKYLPKYFENNKEMLDYIRNKS
jgi:hypothetical protein